MNIGIFTDTYKPNINGVVTSIELKKKELEKLGHKVFIIAPYEPGYKDSEYGVIRLKSFVLIFQPEYRLAYPPTIKVMKKMRKLNLDIVHAETPFSLGLIAAYIAKKQKIPFIHTYHTLFAEYVHYLKLPVAITKKAAEKTSALFCNICDYIVAPSVDVKSELLRYGVKKDIAVLPTGIDHKNFTGSYEKTVREKYGILDDERVLLFVGRLGKEKNIDFLFESFRQLKSEGVEKIKLLLVGDGPYKEELQKLAEEYRINSDVIFAGYVNRGEIAAYYRESDIFVFASLTETQGLVVLEAMASEIPVVAVKASGVEDMIVNNESGYLTENSLNDFNEKIKLMLSDKCERERIIKNGMERVIQFSPEGTAKQLSDIYCSLNAKFNSAALRKALKLRKFRSLKVMAKLIRRK